MNKDIDEFWQQIKTSRDELRVKAHLATLDLKDEWEELEHKWQKAEQKIKHLQDEAIESSVEMKESANVIMEELSSAYARIRNRLKD